MRLPTLLTFAATALAFPSPDSLRQLSERTIASDQCKLPTLPSNCEGVEMQDVIIQLNKLTTEQSQLILDVAKSSGAQIVHNYTGFGISAFVPGPVVDLIKTAMDKVHVYSNACSEIPWCGEAPC